MKDLQRIGEGDEYIEIASKEMGSQGHDNSRSKGSNQVAFGKLD